MGQQQVFAEAPAIAGDFRVYGNSGQITEARQRFGPEAERHQCRARGHDVQAELLGDAVAKRAGAYFRHRQPAARHHQGARPACALIGVDDKPLPFTRYGTHFARHAPVHATALAFAFQHVDDLLRAVDAEQLAQRSLLVPDAVALHQRNEMLRRVARQCGAAEVRILRQEILRLAMPVGEVAAPAAGDADFLGQLARMLDQQYAAAALPDLRRAHHPGGARADDDGVPAAGVRR